MQATLPYVSAPAAADGKASGRAHAAGKASGKAHAARQVVRHMQQGRW